MNKSEFIEELQALEEQYDEGLTTLTESLMKALAAYAETTYKGNNNDLIQFIINVTEESYNRGE